MSGARGPARSVEDAALCRQSEALPRRPCDLGQGFRSPWGTATRLEDTGLHW